MSSDIIKLTNTNLIKLQIEKSKLYGLAFSGGPDSMALAYILKSLGYNNITLIYINYHDSHLVDIEENIVKNASKELNYRLIKMDYYMPSKGNFEDIARKVRYTFFSKVEKENKLDGILIAHQLDDLLCTYIMQLKSNRQVTYYGLKEENYINNSHIYRPMLNIYKQELIDYLNSNNIPFYDDFTNNNLQRTRNNIRINTLPNLDHSSLLKEIETKNNTLSLLIKISCSNKIYYEDYLNLDDKSKLFCIYNYLSINLNNLDYNQILTLRNLIFEHLKKKDTSSIKLNDTYSLYKDYKFFYVIKTVDQDKYEYKNLESKEYDFDQFYIDIKSLNINKLNFPLTIKTVEDNMEFSTNIINKSVTNFIKSQKVPLYLRKIYPVILNKDNKIVYVPFYKDILSKKITLKFKNYIID